MPDDRFDIAFTDGDIRAPDYDWFEDLGPLPEMPARPGVRRDTHILTRALSDERTKAKALLVLRRCVIECEGRTQVLAVLLGVHRVVASRLVSRAELIDLAASTRAEFGHNMTPGTKQYRQDAAKLAAAVERLPRKTRKRRDSAAPK